ncbi:MAG: hypothetical protein JWP03_2288 [Phycisphaerales bacterium]|nr:hypothetical protein [Phycisphaerales bacterium]
MKGSIAMIADTAHLSVLATEERPATQAVAHRVGHSPHGLRRLLQFVLWVVSGFGLLGLFGRRRHYKVQEVVVYSMHRGFFLWALIFTGFVGAAVVHRWPGAAVAMGWVYVWVLVYTFLTVLFDVSMARVILWLGIFAFGWLASKYLEELKHWQVLSPVMVFLRGLRPALNPGFALVLSLFLTVPWVGALFASFTNGRKRITPNEIGEWFLGDGSELTDRSGLKFRTRYRDLLETWLGFGSGDLVALDNSHNVVKRWENILFLFFMWGRLDEILHQRSAVVDNAPDDPVEVEDARQGKES